MLVGGPPFRQLLAKGGGRRVGQAFIMPEFRRYTHALPLSGCPLRFDFHYSFYYGRIVEKAVPVPVLRLFYQASLHRIAVHVAELFDALSVAHSLLKRRAPVEKIPACPSPPPFVADSA